MFRTETRTTQHACILLCLGLSAVLSFAQGVVSSGPQPSTVLSLAPSPRPVGESLARRAGDATFEKVPANYHVFAAATVGEEARVEALTLNFSAETRLTGLKLSNKEFAIQAGGSCYEGNHYSRGDTCSVLVRFTPQGPGHRVGFLKVSNTATITPDYVGLVGNGYAPVVSFTPAQIVTVPGTATSGTGTIKSATNLAVDGGDIVYIPDVGNSVIREMDSSGVIANLNPVFANPQSITPDSAGILYSANVPGSMYYFSIFFPWGVQSSYGTAYAPGSCTPSTPCPLTTVGLSQPANVSIDPYDDLFFEERTKGAAEMPVANLAGGSGSLDLWYLTNQFVYTSGTPAAFAVDGNQNLYNFYNWSTTTCFLQADPVYNAEYSPIAKRVAGGKNCGFSGDGGQARGAEISKVVGQIAFDVAGNLYFTDAGNQRVRRIDAATGIISTIAGNGTAGFGGDGGAATSAKLSNPTGVAVDSQGQVYILSNAPTAGPTQALRRVGVNGYWKFGSQAHGTASAPKLFTVANTGNLNLTLSTNVFFGGTNKTDFSIDPDTTTCVTTAGATLAAGRSCVIGVIFKPAATGSRTANLVLHDNTVTGTNKIVLVGTGI